MGTIANNTKAEETTLEQLIHLDTDDNRRGSGVAEANPVLVNENTPNLALSTGGTRSSLVSPKKKKTKGKKVPGKAVTTTQIQTTKRSATGVKTPNSALQVKKQKTQADMNQTKANLRKIFLNYCEFNKKTGNMFISQIACQRLFKDAKIVTNDSEIKMNDISIMI